jgi:hypothetical protein
MRGPEAVAVCRLNGDEGINCVGARIVDGLWAGEVQPVPSSIQWVFHRWWLQSLLRRVELQPKAAQAALVVGAGAITIGVEAAAGLEIGSRSSEPGTLVGELPDEC